MLCFLRRRAAAESLVDPESPSGSGLASKRRCLVVLGAAGLVTATILAVLVGRE